VNPRQIPLRHFPPFIALLIALSGCAAAVRVDPPAPEGPAAAACRELAGLLPQSLNGAARAESTPPSPYVAVWGEGDIALRCGVPRPAEMAPTDRLSEVNGVGWFPDPARPALFTAVTGTGYVEVTISREHAAGDVLAELAAPIKQALPG
jgi:hypothetical protein